MKTWYLKLSKEQKNDLLQYRDKMKSYAKEYSLTFDTVREKYAQLYLTGLFDDEQDLDRQLKDSLEKARSLAMKRSRKAEWIPIYNGIATQGILARRSMTTGKDKVFLTGCDNALVRMRWHDILILSAIYSLIDKPRGIMTSPKIRITPQDIWRVIMPSADYDSRFGNIVTDTVSKFRFLSGDVAILESDNKVSNSIISESYFLDDSTDENGELSLSYAQEYKTLCEHTGRIARLEQREMSKSRTLEEQSLRTYIMWRVSTGNNEHSRMSKAISLETLEFQTGIDLNQNWSLLKSICKSLKVEIDNSRIWWE